MRFREFKNQKVNELTPAIGTDLPQAGGPAILATKNIAKQIKQQTGKDIPSIPTVNTQIVLPDKETKRPGIYKVKSIKSGEVELDPAMQAPNKPKLSVRVRQADLQNTLNAIKTNQ
jgi:hypothetical protein